MELQIVGDCFSTFDPDQAIAALLKRIHSPKIGMVLNYWLGLRTAERFPDHGARFLRARYRNVLRS